MNHGGRRSSSDSEWRKVKDAVRKRDDGRCRLIRCLTAAEYSILRANAGAIELGIIDPAHYLSVSSRPDLCYDSDNICCINRYSHQNLDDFRSPIDGHHITDSEVMSWWHRILRTNSEQFSSLKKKGLV